MSQRKTYSPADRASCEDAYINEGLTHEEIAERFDVSLSVVKRWSGQYGWKTKRESFQKISGSANSMLANLYMDILREANETKNEGKIYLALKLKRELEERPDPRRMMSEFSTQLVQYLLNHDQQTLAEQLTAVLPAFSRELVG